jgi:hypothetical protein
MKNITALALSAILLSGAAFAQTSVPTTTPQPSTTPTSVPATQPTPVSPATTPVSPQQEPLYKPEGSLTSSPATPQTGNPSEDTLIRGNRKQLKNKGMSKDSLSGKKGKMKKNKKMGTREDTTGSGEWKKDN